MNQKLREAMEAAQWARIANAIRMTQRVEMARAAWTAGRGSVPYDIGTWFCVYQAILCRPCPALRAVLPRYSNSRCQAVAGQHLRLAAGEMTLRLVIRWT